VIEMRRGPAEQEPGEGGVHPLGEREPRAAAGPGVAPRAQCLTSVRVVARSLQSRQGGPCLASCQSLFVFQSRIAVIR